jgi:hypothetical protein
MKRSWNDEALTTAVATNITVAGVLRDLGLSSSPGNYKPVQQRIRQLDLDTKHIKGRAHGTSPGFSKRDTSEILVHDSTYLSTPNLKKRLLKENLLKNECYVCHMGPTWQGQPLTLQLDHINGDPYDNRLENLRIICPNCHAQTKTFTGKNRASRYRRVINHCIDCDSPIDKGSTGRCRKCAGRFKESNNKWPPAKQLAVEVLETSYVAVGKRLGVSDSAVKKYLRRRLGHAPRKHKVAHGGEHQRRLKLTTQP